MVPITVCSIQSANTFVDVTNASFDTYSDYISSLTYLYATAITAIDNSGTIGNNYFDNASEDAEVFFVAGTLSLMADGTSKPIEKIRPGDMVSAVDHNDPEHDTPKPAKVIRFFDNGLKNVVKLIFENQETKEQFEIVCTPSHRFYVKNKGWVNAEPLQTGEQCISSEESEIIFLSREDLEERQKVYNIEVEERHTYYDGNNSTNSILTHNDCEISEPIETESPWWGGTKAGFNTFFSNIGMGVSLKTGSIKRPFL